MTGNRLIFAIDGRGVGRDRAPMDSLVPLSIQYAPEAFPSHPHQPSEGADSQRYPLRQSRLGA